ncbi:MAG: HD domain-containing protein [Thermoprotei archaeon]
MLFYSEIMDPIHGYIPFTDSEKAIIDTEPFQRLHRLKQLGMGFYTYPSATHSRFSHSVGAMHLAGLVGERFVNLELIDKDTQQILRLAALLHDLGHGPFSHSSENVLEQVTGYTHEDMTIKLINESVVGDVIEAAGFSKNSLSKFAVGRSPYNNSQEYLTKIIAGQVDVDKMDFLNRDSYFTGVPYGKVDQRRLIEGLLVKSDNIAINMNALYALEQFIIARYEMFKAVYYHRTVRAAEIMFDRILRYTAADIGIEKDINVDEYLKLDDGYVWSRVHELAKSEKLNKNALRLFRMLNRRELLKSCYEVVRHEIDPQSRIFNNEKILYALVDTIAEEAKVDADTVFIDTPTLPTIPLNNIVRDSFSLTVYDEKTKTEYEASHISPLAQALSRYMVVLRVYTLADQRENVAAVARSIFMPELISEKVSY